MKRSIQMLITICTLCICALCLIPAVNQTFFYANAQTDVLPPARNISPLAYDIESDKVIMFGGLKTEGITDDHYDDTWAYDYNTNSWNNLNPSTSPPERGGNSLAYDEGSDLIILFGGFHTGAAETSVMRNDTWTFDYNTNTWTNKTSEIKPTGRAMAPMVYDSESDVIILFGGGTDGFNLNSETWVYDYNTNNWTNMNPVNSPSARVSVMAYDSESDVVVLFGGGAQNGGVYVDIVTDTWVYDYNTNTWTEMSPAENPESIGELVYDIESDKVIMFGGSKHWVTNDLVSETWTYDYNTNTWTQKNPSTFPEPRFRASMAYDSESNRTILLSGGWWESGGSWFAFEDCWAYDLDSDTWELMISLTTTPTGIFPPIELIALAVGSVVIVIVIVVYVKMRRK